MGEITRQVPFMDREGFGIEGDVSYIFEGDDEHRFSTQPEWMVCADEETVKSRDDRALKLCHGMRIKTNLV